MKFQFENWSLTSREIYLVIVWLAVYMLCGLGMTTCINDSNADHDAKYIQALGIEANGDKMMQAMITDAGDAIVSGEFEVVDPVSDSNLDGKWLKFTAIYEEEELEVNTGIDADGNVYTYNTWEWHEKKRWSKCATKIKCNGIEFPVHSFDYGKLDEKYRVVNISDGTLFSHKSRIRFCCKQPKFKGAFFTTFNDKKMEAAPVIYPDKTHEKLREELTTHYDDIFAWVLLSMVFFVMAAFFVYAENDWLENMFKK